ncbi:BrnA antitoxin family protein [Segnochrobactrum spirostomi]|uniref:BrnA antitoxin family protein n=1 Tax=Segnochrobactrum spirostomi TaxID=2608987 RepID=A0A6A7XY76_9HYPH|nr:BrnA antitoxin family protein [Segnochrobactrum spirostomi]MQT11308.1 hypothetical protein [Segnochrobactrum spirostomi]
MSKAKSEGLARARAIALSSLAEISDEEDAALTAAALSDADNPPRGDQDPRLLRPATEVAPELVAAWRGRATEWIELELDRDVLEKFRATGPGWQQRLNDVLRRAVG